MVCVREKEFFTITKAGSTLESGMRTRCMGKEFCTTRITLLHTMGNGIKTDFQAKELYIMSKLASWRCLLIIVTGRP